MIHEGATPGHITDLHITAHHTTETQAHITTNETLHIEGPITQTFFQRLQWIQTMYITQKHHITSSKPSSSSNRTTSKNKDRAYK